MNDDLDKKINVHFFTLVSSLQAAAWQQMGKIASPVSGKTERNLEQAKMSIDMLNMISEKTEGNLSDEESKMLSNALYELRMNFVDESGKPDSNSTAEATEESGDQSEENGDKKAEENSEPKPGE